jgi:hypothetical protein
MQDELNGKGIVTRRLKFGLRTLLLAVFALGLFFFGARHLLFPPRSVLALVADLKDLNKGSDLTQLSQIAERHQLAIVRMREERHAGQLFFGNCDIWELAGGCKATIFLFKQDTGELVFNAAVVTDRIGNLIPVQSSREVESGRE